MPQTGSIMQSTTSQPAVMAGTHRMTGTRLTEMISFQMGALQGYLDLALTRMRAVIEVRRIEDLPGFYLDQLEAAGTLQHMMIDHARTLTQIAMGMQNSRNLAGQNAALLQQSSDKIASFTGQLTDRTAASVGQTVAAIERTDEAIASAVDTVKEATEQAADTAEKTVDTATEMAHEAVQDTATGDQTDNGKSGPTKDELYRWAQELEIEGRGYMNKAELQEAVTRVRNERLDTLKREDLYHWAQELEIEGRSAMDREQLIQAIRQA